MDSQRPLCSMVRMLALTAALALFVSTASAQDKGSPPTGSPADAGAAEPAQTAPAEVAPTPAEQNVVEKVYCSKCGVEILPQTGVDADADGNPICPACAAAVAAVPKTQPYDIRTTKKLTGDWFGARTAAEDVGISFNPLFVGTWQMNFRGGVNTHNAHETAGKAFWALEFDFEKMLGIPGASMFVRGIQAWNRGVQPDVGSLTPPFYSAGSTGDRAIELDKYWWRQRLFDDRLEFRLGKLLNTIDLFDRNAFALSYSTQFSNRVFVHNMTLPSAKGLGAFLRVWPVDWLYVQGAVIDAEANNAPSRHGTGSWDTAFSDACHWMTFWEFGLTPKFDLGNCNCLPGNYRFGGWYDPRQKNVWRNVLSGLLHQPTVNGDYGFYMNFDQVVFKENPSDAKDKQGLGLFARYGFAHDDVNRIAHFWSCGASYLGLIPTRDGDTLGFGVAQNILSSKYRGEVNGLADRETVYELYYSIKFAPWCYFTPDVQIITNPGGNKNARDSIVGGCRLKITF